jgi:hypothetical protein
MCIPQLTKVKLYCGSFYKPVGLNVQIEAPIKYLTISDWHPAHKTILKNRDSLIGAKLTLVKSYKFQGRQRDELLKILEAVDKVQYLSLFWHVINAIKASSITLPLFSNVIRLEVFLGCKDFYKLECLLNSTINLQILLFWMPYYEEYTCRKKGCTEEDGQWSKSHVPKCVQSSLKRIEIFRLSNCPGELAMIKNMLKSAEVLEKLTWKSEVNSDMHRKISTFPRASASCQLEFPGSG